MASVVRDERLSAEQRCQDGAYPQFQRVYTESDRKPAAPACGCQPTDITMFHPELKFKTHDGQSGLDGAHPRSPFAS